MAIQQVLSVYLNLKGDGAATTFSFALQNLYQFSNGAAIPFGGAGVVPTAVSVNNPPVPVTSATVDANGNITITLTSALGNGIIATFQLDLTFNSGASSSSSATQTTNVTIVGSSAVSATQSGTWTTRVVGNAGATLDAAGQNAASPANSLLMAGQFNTTPTTIVSGNISPMQLDNAGNLLVNVKAGGASGAVAQGSTTSGQSGNLTQGAVTTSNPTYTTGQTNPFSLDTSGNLRVVGSFASGALPDLVVAISLTAAAQTAVLTMAGRSSGSVILTSLGTGGTINFEYSQDGANWTTSDIWSETAQVWTTGINISGTGSWWFEPIGAVNAFRIRCTSITSGTITGTLLASTMPMSIFKYENSANQVPKHVVNVAALTSTSAPSFLSGQANQLSMDLSGNLRVVGGALPDLVGTPGTLNANGTTAVINSFGYTSVGMFLAAGTLIGTIVPEASLDGGTTWVGTFFDDPTTSNKVSSIVFGSANAATSRSIIGVSGASNYRVRVSAFTSGTASCTLRANESADLSVLYAGAAGGTLPPSIAQVGGSVTTAAPTYTTGTVNALSLDTSGNVRTSVGGTVAVTQSTSPWVVSLTSTTLSQLPTAAASADALANPTITQIGCENMVFNGTTWDRERSAGIGNNVASTGLQADVGYGQFNSTLPTVTTGNYAAIQIDSSGRTMQSPLADNASVSTALGALNAAVSVSMAGYVSAGFFLAAGTLIGTIIPEISYDGGTTWVQTQFYDPVHDAFLSSVVFGSANTVQSFSIDTLGGVSNVRVRVSAFTSGTANGIVRATVVGRSSQTVTQIDGFKTTYAVGTQATATAGTGVILQIQGSATKTVRITRIHLKVYSATAAETTLKLQRTSAAATLGTPGTLTPAAKADNNDAASTAVVTHWTATGGTTGTVNGNPFLSDTCWMPSSTFAAPGSTDHDRTWLFGQMPGTKEIVLRGTTDFMTVTSSGTTAGSQVWIEWTEE